MLNTKQQGTAQGAECIIRVKDGTLAPRGKGTLMIRVMPDGQVTLSATLPSVSGVPQPFDLMSLQRLELVKTRTGWYQGNQWIKPTVAILGAVVGPFIILPMLISSVPSSHSFDWFIEAIVEGLFIISVTGMFSIPALVYAGSKLPRIARFVAVTHDGRYCVAEMDEAAFRFLQGIRAAMNLHIQTDAAVATPDTPEATPVPA